MANGKKVKLEIKLVYRCSLCEKSFVSLKQCKRHFESPQHKRAREKAVGQLVKIIRAADYPSILELEENKLL